MNNQIDQITSEQHLHIDNQQDQNSTLNYFKSKQIINKTKKIKKSPMNPTLLYVYFFSFAIQHSNISLENIHGGQHIKLKQL
jgi:GTP-dependent phosphoenolpyruvate carboxykinase